MALPFLPTDFRMKIFKTRTRLEDFTDYEVRKHCAMPLLNVRELFEEFEPRLQPMTRRSQAILPETRLLIALSFFRSGSFQYVQGTVGGMSQASISLSLERVSKLIVEDFATRSIVFPTTVSELNRTKEKLYEISQFPNIGGVIDGTHVGIKPPHHDEHMFVNRKTYHSINAQLVCDGNNIFTDAVVKWPGSTHDSYIWNNSGLKQRFLDGDFGETWLIGKSIYLNK